MTDIYETNGHISKFNMPIIYPLLDRHHPCLCCYLCDRFEQVGGWSQVYKGLTLVSVRGAGHEVPLHRPRQALILFQHFLHGKPMPKNGTAV